MTLTQPLPSTAAGSTGPDPTTPALRLQDVTKSYPGGVTALDHLSLQVPPGSFLAVMGPSGSGKSTLLHCASGLDGPTSGTVLLGDTEVTRLSEAKRTILRRGRIGFIFQAYNLVPSLTVEHNITLPLRLAGAPVDRAWLEALVDRIGLTGLLGRLPSELSGGQQQRAAIARSLAARPDVVFADEPTGALDLDTAAEVLTLLRDLVDEFGQTVVMVTHDPTAAAWAHETVVMKDGGIHRHFFRPAADELAECMRQLRTRA